MLESRCNISGTALLCATALVSVSKIHKEPGTESRIRALREKGLRFELVAGHRGEDELLRWTFCSTWL
ncbi:hypothetical protein R3P38DRAFT_3030264 [Favolaschia claudopus]|uniref:Uncharacterized protein n=1 Tax=Favolaschia claudopus TaxID=2862362 RepID=A0AAW0ADT1_9AGAR